MANDAMGRTLAAQLQEMRGLRKSAQKITEHLDAQITRYENTMIEMGIAVPQANGDEPEDGGDGPAENPDLKATGDTAAEQDPGTQTAGAGEPDAERTGPGGGGEDGQDAAANPKAKKNSENGARLAELQEMPKDGMTHEEKLELEMMVQLAACPNQKSIMRTIALRDGTKLPNSHRIQISSAAILVIGAGRSHMEARPLANHLRHTIVTGDAGHWIVDENKNDAEFFPNGIPGRERGAGESGAEPIRENTPEGMMNPMLPLRDPPGNSPQ